MRRFHFVHTAGLRLNAPFAAVGRLPAPVRDVLAEAPLRAWEDLVDASIEKRAAFLLIAGGIDGGGGSHAALLRFRNGLRRLTEGGVKAFLALGDGDGDVARVVAEARIAGVTVFPSEQPAAARVERGGAALAVVCGQSAPENGEVDVASYFAHPPEGLPLIGVLPGSLPDLDQRLAARGKVKGSYWALGTAPEPSRRGFAPWLVESGSLQARSNDRRERGARGAMLVEVEGDRVLAVDHLPIDRVRYAELALAPRFPLDASLLRHQILDELNRLRAAHAGRGLLVDVDIAEPGRGSDPLAAAQRDRALLQRLREETASWDPFVWCASLRSRDAAVVEPAADPTSQAIVQEGRALLANPLQRSYSFARRFDPLMRRFTSELDSGTAERLIGDATAIALAAARLDGATESAS